MVLTCATLKLGGGFDGDRPAGSGLTGDDAPAVERLDVGSPFDYPKQGILYVARHLPPPGRDGASRADMPDELADPGRGGRRPDAGAVLLDAGRARSRPRRCATGSTCPILLQGEDTLRRRSSRAFAADPATCLFGTLSLWQGVDVPGAACQLVVIDRIPFPRPDDPLMSARAAGRRRRRGQRLHDRLGDPRRRCAWRRAPAG